MSAIPVWMDCDTGTDDAVAIMLAHSLEELELLGLSSVCGNTTLENAFLNTHRINRLMGTDYPVYRGSGKPMKRELQIAAAFHGENGLGNVELPLPENPVIRREPAWDAIYACASKMPKQLRLVATGPLTNIAAAFMKYPNLPGLLHSLTVMGGSAGAGNITPYAEFNIYTDPHAADIVFRSGVPLVMCGLDVTLQAYLTPEDLDELESSGTRTGSFTKACLQCALNSLTEFGLPRVAMHDSCPVMYLAHPELFEGKEAAVTIETRESVTSGKTVTDLFSETKAPFKNALVLLKLDRERFIRILKDCITRI